MKLLIISIVICSCNSITRHENSNKNDTLGSITGNAFLQPVDKTISLVLASNRMYITIDFLDSTYCNVKYHGPQSISISKKYNIDDQGIIKFYDPSNNKEKKFQAIIENGISYFLDVQNHNKLYKIIPETELNTILLSNNELKINDYLYPTLNVEEQEYGAESRYEMDSDGVLREIEHPLKKEIRRINIFDLF